MFDTEIISVSMRAISDLLQRIESLESEIESRKVKDDEELSLKMKQATFSYPPINIDDFTETRIAWSFSRRRVSISETL